ncbi:hypothetical protein NFI96_024832 [Prochilodus magdalenae]|nr:hypothetical protein NFI96_024832 [Prochilodus magdalenae]
MCNLSPEVGSSGGEVEKEVETQARTDSARTEESGHLSQLICSLVVNARLRVAATETHLNNADHHKLNFPWVGTMQNNKAPGPDGFPVEFYKKFSDKLVPLLLAVFNESLSSGILPQNYDSSIYLSTFEKRQGPHFVRGHIDLFLF